ncbi:hypothetical protein [Actinokineospora globicatena]|uniref:Uncharacterized protein n=1 Tax=Actinokineospora globicatena TaxID=103729 RepID=A0A9W6QQW1_9PSEU|nr:hypothetical protein [Actinokineospora globicatena]MCP2300742.1 hypothetical protein [Actinokineospora globicatena]GLW77633.1 hypothetical protein Aglo01_21150 [Actinokineospora globicatena]GLW84469.1 hypothetical protein Aglo02_21090 [Actinokineospora globicatena]GLW92949.1 hypothetical protein Aglo03_37650 [Actinokineospora globicatena]
MSQPLLAEHVVDILTRLVTHRVDGASRRAADTLSDAVIGRLRRIRRAAVFDLFEADPHAPGHRRTLVDLLNSEFAHDQGFREAVAGLAAAAGAPAPQEEAPKRDPRPSKRVLLGAGAAVAAIALTLGGRALYLQISEAAELDGTTPCRTFWALKEPEQRGLLVRAYETHGQKRRTDDPYLVARVLYACGQNPENTVDQIITADSLRE